MNVAIFSATLPPYPCGVGKHAYFLANAVQQAGHHVTMVTLRQNQQATTGKFKLDSSLKKFGLFEYLRWARKNQGKYDIVHLQYPTKLNRRGLSVVLLPWILRLFGFRAILTLHELTEASLPGKIRNIILSTGFSRIILPNPLDGKWLPHKANAIQHITLGPTLIPGQSKPVDIKRFSIGFLGFMDGSKGEQDLISSLAKLKNSTEVYFLSRFDPRHNPHHASLDKQVKSLGLTSVIKWVSPVNDQHILDYLQKVDLVAMPFVRGVTKRNSTLLEAIAAAKPLVVSDGGQLPDYLKPQENCLAYQPGRIDDLAQAIDLLSSDKRLRDELGKEMGKLASQFSWPAIASQTIALYKRIL